MPNLSDRAVNNEKVGFGISPRQDDKAHQAPSGTNGSDREVEMPWRVGNI